MLIAIERGDVTIEEAGAAPHAISVITVSEILHGVHRADPVHRTRRRLAVDRTLALFDALPITEDVARIHAEVGAELATQGLQIATNDLWIGATALVHDLQVATRDRRSFERIPGLDVLSPTGGVGGSA